MRIPFLHITLSTYLYIHIYTRVSVSLSIQGSFSQDCPKKDIHISERIGVQIYHNCGNPGHKRSECPEKSKCKKCDDEYEDDTECKLTLITCRKCNETGHYSKDCPQKEVRKCRKCDAEDHIAADCSAPSPAPSCFNCGEQGHSFFECEQPTATTCGKHPDSNHSWSDCPDNPSHLGTYKKWGEPL